MSFEAQAYTWTLGIGSPRDLMVCLYLAEKANKSTHTCFPSVETIAKATNLSDSSVRRALKSLEAQGYISITKRKSSSMVQRSSLYKLLFVESLQWMDPLPTVTVTSGSSHGDRH